MRVDIKTHQDTEQESRENLAALYRLYAKFGWTDLNQTHAAARVPGNPTHFFIKPDEYLMEEVTASSLSVVDLNGNQVSGDSGVNRAGALIHAAILGARPKPQVAMSCQVRLTGHHPSSIA